MRVLLTVRRSTPAEIDCSTSLGRLPVFFFRAQVSPHKIDDYGACDLRCTTFHSSLLPKSKHTVCTGCT